MSGLIARSVIKALPVAAGAIGAWAAANYTFLHTAFCAGGVA
jgi:uncharacterized protein (DUF697 family)